MTNPWLIAASYWLTLFAGMVMGSWWGNRPRDHDDLPAPTFPIAKTTYGSYVCHHCGAPSCQHLQRWALELEVWRRRR